ncbi:MAG: hypothetical protein IT423_15960 [Pirellulaceae bacterium]|nr:hypothetical protein [Pirellulaceae bacterium]
MRCSNQLPNQVNSSCQFSLYLFSLRVARVGLLAFSVSLLGCEARQPDAASQASRASVQAPAQPDDAQAVAMLEKAGAKLKKGSAGNIEQVDLQEAGGGNLELFTAVAKLPGVRAVICTGPDVTNEAVAALKNHTRLERLAAVDRSAIGDAGIEALASIPTLMDLTLERSEITDGAYAHLAKIKKLKYLRANLTKTTDAGIKQLAAATQLELLDLRDCTGISDEGLQSLEKLTKMRSLKLWGRQITDASLSVMGKMTNLTSLGLQDTAVTGAGGALSSLTKLVDLDAFRSTFGDEGIKSVVDAKGLKVLKLRDCQVTADGLKVLSGFTNLERLDLSESQADDSTLETIAGLTKLVELELWLSRVSDAGLANIVKLPLKSLTVEDVYDISDAGMEHIGQIKSLESLTLSKTGVTDEGLAKLYGLENLQVLYLDNTVVSKAGVEALKAKLPKLTKVSY